MFHSHDGLIECQDFKDFYHYITSASKAEIKCPQCSYIMQTHIYPTFNMLNFGRAEFTCTNTDCHFNKNHIIVEATGGKPHGLERICFGPRPGNY